MDGESGESTEGEDIVTAGKKRVGDGETGMRFVFYLSIKKSSSQYVYR